MSNSPNTNKRKLTKESIMAPEEDNNTFSTEFKKKFKFKI